jgi:hypothetical protein
MKDNSFFSLIILLVLFFVLPAVLKFLGQYTLSSRNAPQTGEEKNVPQVPGEEPAAYHEDYPAGGGFDISERPVISNEPIHPRWF